MVPKIRGTFLVPIRRSIVFWGHVGVPLLGETTISIYGPFGKTTARQNDFAQHVSLPEASTPKPTTAEAKGLALGLRVEGLGLRV